MVNLVMEKLQSNILIKLVIFQLIIQVREIRLMERWW
jgi:hypothetical protein